MSGAQTIGTPLLLVGYALPLWSDPPPRSVTFNNAASGVSRTIAKSSIRNQEQPPWWHRPIPSVPTRVVEAAGSACGVVMQPASSMRPASGVAISARESIIPMFVPPIVRRGNPLTPIG